MASNQPTYEARPFLFTHKLGKSSFPGPSNQTHKEPIRPEIESLGNISNISTKTSKTNDDISKTMDDVYQEEQRFVEALNKTNQLEDPLSLWSKYYKWCRTNFAYDEEKQFNVLGDLTRTLSQCEKYKQDPNYIAKWISYAKLCVDQEEILKYMEENNIGTQLASFYKTYCVVCIRKRNFSKANDWILLGKKKNASPVVKMDEFIKEFEANMKERLDRDFYSQGKFLTDDDYAEIPILSSSQQQYDFGHNTSLDSLLDEHSRDEPESLKRKYPFNHPGMNRIKKVRLNDLVNSVKMGEFNIYVDKDCREAIPETTRLVNEYDALCYKYNFSLQPPPPEGKFMSWISQQVTKLETSMSLDVSNTTTSNISCLKDDSLSIENPLVAQFQLPKRLRKPLREIKITKPSPKSKGNVEAGKQSLSVPAGPVLEKNSQEITEQYKPKMNPIFEEDIFEEGNQEGKERRISGFLERKETREEEKQAGVELDHFSFLFGKGEVKQGRKDSMKQVKLPEQIVDGSDHEKFRKRIKKTPHVINKNLGGLSDRDEEDEEANREEVKAVEQRSVVSGPVRQVVKEEKTMMGNLMASRYSSGITVDQSSTNVSRNLNFEGISDEEEEKRARETEQELRRSPLYKDLFGDERDGKKSIKRSVTRKVEAGPSKGNVKESRKRIIPAIYRGNSVEVKNVKDISDFEKYLFGNFDYKELRTPRKGHNSDDLNELLFSVPRGEYLN